MLARAFLPYKKSGGTIVAYSSGFGFLPPGLPFLQGNSAYSTSKLGTARFYEFLAVEHPDLNVFVLQPGVIRTALYEKGKLQLDNTIDSSKSGTAAQKVHFFIAGANRVFSQFNFPPISRCGWRAPMPSRSPDASCLPTGTWNC